MAGCIVKYKKSLSPALGEAFKDIDGLIDLPEKIIGIEVSIAILAHLEDNLGFSDRYEMCEIYV
jgi:hypothetical protein